MTYPFTAIVGQETLKKALLLCAINPAIGGLLISGDKGTAKSTAARALAEVLPSIQKSADCLFNCSEDAPLPECEACSDAPMQTVSPVPFVNLPLGATEERVIGSLDFERVLAVRKKRLLPGLLAAAHRGILYVDEVNLLADHLVDVLLDTAASGVNVIERDGFSLSHPARFLLIGTMNPEEGRLRPQLLDRFGLKVTVEAPADVSLRTEIVRRRIAFEADKEAFISAWKPAQALLKRQLESARELLPGVSVPDALLDAISKLCVDYRVKSLRADIVIFKTTRTLSALNGRSVASEADVQEAAALVLGPHVPTAKSNQRPAEKKQEKGPGEERKEFPGNDPHERQTSADAAERPNERVPPSPLNERIDDPEATGGRPTIQFENDLLKSPLNSGNRVHAEMNRRGRLIRTTPSPAPAELAFEATVYQALKREPGELSVQRQDLQEAVRVGKSGNLVLFLVDASGSMGAHKRMSAVKGAVLALLAEAYEKRDLVGVIAFRGIDASVLLPPTMDTILAEDKLAELPTGGRTPLAQGLLTAIELLRGHQNLKPLLVLLTDGRANVALNQSGDPWGQSLELAAQLRAMQTQSLVINTENDYLRVGRAAELAHELGAGLIELDGITADSLVPAIHKLQE